MNKFNKKIFLIASLAMVILTASLWTLMWAHEERHMVITNGVWNLILATSSILRFPVYTLCWNFLIANNNQIFNIIGWLMDCAFWGVILERIISLFPKKRETRRSEIIL